MTKHYCKTCFRGAVDPTAPDSLLLMSGDDKVCPMCNSVGPIVASYFKYGEHIVKPDTKHTVGQAKYVGANMNYCAWKDAYPYKHSDVPEES